MSAELSVRQGTDGRIITEQAAAMTRDQVELLKRTICKGSTDDELQLFVHACNRTKLDPFMKQIHAVKRWDAREQKEVMSIQTGIDGYRLIADRTGLYAGSDEPKYGPAKDGYPESASVTVHKIVAGQPRPFSATARWTEYRQTKKDGSLVSMWAKMPYNQLAKCAEALALRKGFPAELSGLYTHEEMGQAENPEPRTVEAVVKDAPPPPHAPTEAAPAQPAPSSPVGDGSSIWKGVIAEVAVREQEIKNGNDKGKVKKAVKIVGADGFVAGLFINGDGDSNRLAMANDLKRTQEMAVIHWRPSKDGRFNNVVSIEPLGIQQVEESPV